MHEPKLLARVRILLLCSASALASPLHADLLWRPTGELAIARQSHTATALSDGSVLVTGGFASIPVGGGTLLSSTDTVERYSPATDRWSSAGAMTRIRSSHSATLLADGSVLVAGGSTAADAEIFDPAGSSWSATAAMRERRENHTATLLGDGRVLVAGGFTRSERLASAEIYDPGTRTWSMTGAMRLSRMQHAAARLADGRVLVTGGTSGARRSAEIYDPASGQWTPAASLPGNYFDHTATTLADGRVLIVGGAGAATYDPSADRWTPTGAPVHRRSSHTATRMPGGKVLVAGGISAFGNEATPITELFDPATDTWSELRPMTTPRARHAAVLLAGRGALVIAGATYGGPRCCTTDAERFGNGPPPVGFVVNDPLDTVDAHPGDGRCRSASGRCSLRAAIMESNALPGANFVVLPAGVFTLALAGAEEDDDATGDLDVRDALSLRGAGAGATAIDAAGLDRALHVGPGELASIEGVTLRGGLAASFGGGILNQGILRLADAAVSGNAAPDGFGGGIYNTGELLLSGVTLDHNLASAGGGVYNAGRASIVNSTLSRNRGTSGNGGGLQNTGLSALAHLSASTLTDNEAAGAGGGFANECNGELCAALYFDASIVAGNHAPDGPDCFSGSGFFGATGTASRDFNVVGDATRCGFGPRAGNRVGTGAAPLDARLAPLGRYGGPTPTIALLSGSPAIDRAPTAECAAGDDQRGRSRPEGDGCDAGAFERAACTASVAVLGAGERRRSEFTVGSATAATWAVYVFRGHREPEAFSTPVPPIDPPVTVDAGVAPGTRAILSVVVPADGTPSCFDLAFPR